LSVVLSVVGTTLFIASCGTAKTASTSATTGKDHSIQRVSEKGPVKLVVRVTPDEPRLSDLVDMEVVVSYPSGVDIKPPAFGQAVGDFVIRDYSERSDVKDSNATKGSEQPKQTRRFVYKLEPASAGRHIIRSIAVEFVDNRPLSEQKGVKSLVESDPMEVNVTSELGDGIPNLANLEPMVPPRPLEQSTSSYWIVATLAAVLFVVAVILFRRRRKEFVQQPIQRTPEEIAHMAFAALLAENLPAKGLYKEFYLRLTGIVRHFIEGTTGLRAPEQTTEEFLRAMRKSDVFSAERSVRLKEFLEAADMVKYAGQQPDNDQIELSIARAREFVHYRPAALVTAEAGEA
jgi:hypothetical protein